MSFLSSDRSPVLLSSSCAIPFAIAASMLLLSSVVGAVDILLCPVNDCGGTCIGCYDTPSSECCLPPTNSPVDPAPSVEVRNADIDREASSLFYTSQGCSGTLSRRGTGNNCQSSLFASYTGALWLPPATNRSLRSVDTSETIPLAGHMYANAAFFTEHGKEGQWVLPVANFTEYFSQVGDLSDAGTLDWFKSQGAFYKP